MKSKFFVAAFAMAMAFTASAAVTVADMGTMTLRRGSTGTPVMKMQEALNACTGSTLVLDGKFGPATTGIVKNFQTSKGLVADGLVGAKTKAMFAACSTTTTTTTTTTTPVVMSGTEGYVADTAADATNRVSNVYEGTKNQVVAGFRTTARLADQKVESITVTFKNTNTASSSNLAKYVTDVNLMDGTTVLATMPVLSLDRSSSDTFTAQFTGFSKVIAKDTIGRLSIAVNATPVMDSNDATNASWDVSITGFRTTSPNGVYVSNSSNLPVTVTGVKFGKFSNSGVRGTVTLGSTNPLAMTKEVSETASTNDIKLLDFKVKAEVSEMTLRNLPVKIALTIPTASTVDQPAVINNIKLMKDGVMIDSVSPAAGTKTVMGTNDVYMTSYLFANIAPASAKIAAGTEATFSILVDVKASKNGATVVYPSGTTSLTASVSNVGTTATTAITGVANTTIGQPSYPAFSLQDVNGDQVASRSGSAAGNAITLAARGVSVAYATASAGTLVPGPISGSFATRIDYVDVNVSAFGDTIYVADIFTLANATAKDSTNATVTPTTVTISAAPGETITKQASDYVVNSGETKKFRIAISLTGTAATATKQVKSQVSAFEVKVGSAGAAVTAQALDVNTFQTSFAAL